jgi:alpha-L-fucosidase
MAQSTTSEGTPVRFTQRQRVVYALLLGLPGSGTFSLPGIEGGLVTDVRLLGLDQALVSGASDRGLTVTLPERVPFSAVHVLHLGTGARPAGATR